MILLLARGGGDGVCRGAGGGGGVIVVRVCEPEFRNLPHSYTCPLRKWTHSYTWSSKILTYSYRPIALWFSIAYPFIAGSWHADIAVNLLNTKRTSSQPQNSLKKSMSEKIYAYTGMSEKWVLSHTLRKHAYSNTLKILPPKNDNFSDKKFWYFSYFCSKHRLWVLVRTASPRRF